MSLITDPWDDDDVQIEELDSRFKKIRTVQHRTVSKGLTNKTLMSHCVSFVSFHANDVKCFISWPLVELFYFQHSAWNDTSAPNRPALAQVEIKPTVRIMRRDTNPENEQKKPDSPEIAKQ